MTSSQEIPQPVVIPGEAPLAAFGASDLVISISPLNPDGVITVALTGELDIDAAARVRSAVTGVARSRGCRRLVVDLAEVSFVDSTGLGALVAGFNVARTHGATYAVINPQPMVRRSLDITGLSGPFGLGIVGPRQSSE